MSTIQELALGVIEGQTSQSAGSEHVIPNLRDVRKVALVHTLSRVVDEIAFVRTRTPTDILLCCGILGTATVFEGLVDAGLGVDGVVEGAEFALSCAATMEDE